MQTSGPPPPPSAPPPPPPAGPPPAPPPGFAHAPGFGPPTGGFAMPAPKKGMGLSTVAMIGCGVVALITCAGGGACWGVSVYTARKASERTQELSHSLATDIMRAGVITSLTGVQSACAIGDCAPAAQYVHPGVQSALTPILPTVTRAALDVLENPARTRAELLEGTDDASRATALGLVPSACVRLTSGRAKVIGCSTREASGTEVFLLVHLEGLDSLE